MNSLKDLKSTIEKEIDKLKNSINYEKQIRDSSPSAMESHHDTTRNQTEQMVSALEEQLTKLTNAKKTIPDTELKGDVISLWKVANLEIGNKKIAIMIVPEGLGGYKSDGFKTLSVKTPLGKLILNKREGYQFEINNNKGLITKVSKN